MKVRAFLTLVVVFVLGIAGGLGLAPLLHPPPARGMEPLERLHLRPDQRTKIRAIVDAHGPEVEKATNECAPQLRTIRDEVAHEIEGILDDEQRAQFQRDRAKGPPPRP